MFPTSLSKGWMNRVIIPGPYCAGWNFHNSLWCADIITVTESWAWFYSASLQSGRSELHLISIFHLLVVLSHSCSTKFISVYRTLLWDVCEIHNGALRLWVLHPPPPPPAKAIESDSWEGGWCHCSFSATLCWDGRQQVRLSADCRVILCCCFGRWAALLPGGSCWQRQLWLCVSCKSYSPSQLPFCPLPRPNGPHSGSNPCLSQSWELIWTYVCSPELWLCSRAQANQTG